MSSASQPEIDVLIVGGGIAGLTTAYDLDRAGRRVLLCEARARLGGLIHTETVSKCVLEAGPDSMLTQKPAALALCAELELNGELVSTIEPRTAFVLRDGALHAIPSEAVLGLPVTQDAIDRCTMLSPAGRASLARDLTAPSTARTTEPDESVGALFRRRFDAETVRYLAQPLLGGIHAGDVDQLSIRALFPTLSEADVPGVSLLQTLAGRLQRPSAEGTFRSLRHGMSTLVDALTARLPRSSVSPATDVHLVSGGPPFAIETASGRLSARALVLAVPAWQATRLLRSLDLDLALACAAISYASTATISLAYRQEDVTAPLLGTGFVVPRNDPTTRLLAASWVTSKWPGRAPEGIVLLRAFAGGVLDTDLLDLDDDALVSMAHRDLASLLRIGRPPLFARTYRWQSASAQYDVGHLSRVAAIEAAAARWPGLYLTGSAYRGVGIPDCVADARATAARVVRALETGR